MVRLAKLEDADKLYELNALFNGEALTTIDNIRVSLLDNKQEIVVVKEVDNNLVGFLCAQIKRSFCYREVWAEITELYVKPEYRKQGFAKEMIMFIEDYLFKHHNIVKFEILTGRNNLIAQEVYGKLGYQEDNEIHLRKII